VVLLAVLFWSLEVEVVDCVLDDAPELVCAMLKDDASAATASSESSFFMHVS
jgi:hypothetical protein